MKTLNYVTLLVASCLPVAAYPAPANHAKAFLTEAIKGDNSEVSMGKLASERGSSPAAKSYGRMLVEVHGAHRQIPARGSKP